MKYLSTASILALLLVIYPVRQPNAQATQTFNGHNSFVYDVAFSSDGEHLLSGSRDGNIKLWDVVTGDEEQNFGTFRHSVESVAMSPDGEYVVSGTSDGKMVLWDVNTGKKVRSFSGHDKSVNSIAFTPDGEYVLSGSKDQTMKFWKVATGMEARTFDGHNYGVNSVAVSPDGKYALTGSLDETMKLWNMNTGREIRTFRGHSKSVESVAFSPDGKYALSGSRDRTLKLWKVESGKEVRTFSRHNHSVESVAISPDGRYVLSGSRDRTIKLWERSTGDELRTYKGHNHSVESVAFSSDGQYVASGSYDKTVKLWGLSHKTLVSRKVQKRIKKWQEKGKYETTKAYQKRVTETKRKKLIKSHTNQIVDSLGRAQFNSKIAKTNYDADNQTFEVTFEDQSTIYVEVPVSEAPTFDKNLERLKFSNMNFSLTDDNQLVLRKADIYNPGNDKMYSYDSGREVAFNTTQLAANFDPINVNVETENSGPNVKKNTQKIEVGQSNVDLHVPETPMSKPDAIAVVIGNRRYQGDTPNVDYAVNDAKVMQEYLVKTLGFKPGNILYQENASRNEMVVLFGNQREQGKLANYVKPGKSDVFVFYSGHGAPDPNTETGYLMPVDADPTALSLTGYSLNVLYDNLGELDAKSINVIVDACFSGATGEGNMLVKNASPIGIKVKNPAAKLDDGFVVTASSGSQVASWYPEKGHGLLTYFWLKGLQGAADLNGDGKITTGEINQYLTDSTEGLPYWARRLHNREQVPQIFGSESDDVIVQHDSEG